MFDYNNADYIILGVIAERVTGKPYADLLKARILDPTGMTGSGVLSQSRILTGLAPTYMRAREGEPLINDMPVYSENWYAAGAMYSTSADLARFAEALFASRLLKTESLRLMLTPGLDDYGYGIWISAQNVQGRNHPLAHRPGQIMGANVALVRYLDDGLTVIILSNTNLTDVDKFAFVVGKVALER